MITKPPIAFSINRLFYTPVDNAPLIVFRFFFGLLAAAESFGAILTGWVKNHLIAPEFTFTFIGFDWLQPLPGNMMYYYYIVMGLTGLMIMAGFYYRIATILFSILWTSVYLMEKSEYNNHYYMLVLLSILMAIVPAEEDYSLDSRRKKIRSRSCPNWCLLIFQFQFALVYFYAGLNKLYPDWLQGHYINTSFGSKINYPIIGPYLNTTIVKSFVTYGGIAFDLLIVPALLYRKTRLYGFACLLFFHLFNSLVFQIGIFPYLMIGASVFFFPPEKIRSLFFKNSTPFPATMNTSTKRAFGFPSSILLSYMFIQLLLPLRPFFYPGDSHWTEQGHRMSWRMMLRRKSGSIYYKVKDANNNVWIEDPSKYLTTYQLHALTYHPDLIWQFAGILKTKLQQKNIKDPRIFAYSYVSINGHPPQLMIDTLTDLGSVEWNHFSHSPWIVPRKSISEEIR